MGKARGKPTPHGVVEKTRARPAPEKHPPAIPAKQKKIVAPVKRAKPVALVRPKRAKVVVLKRVVAVSPRPSIEETTRPVPRRKAVVIPPPAPSMASSPSLDVR